VKHIRFIRPILFLIIFFSILSCPNPINESMLLHIKDTFTPTIVITRDRKSVV